MSIIDTRLAEIQTLQQKFVEVQNQPELAIKVGRQMSALQNTLQRDMAPIYALMAKTSFLS